MAIGGLAGIPFAGRDGWSELIQSVPDNEGSLFVLYAPHIGISKKGTLGVVQRPGMEKETTSCKAAVDAYQAVKYY